MSGEIRVRTRSQKGPTALERLERLNDRVRREIDRRMDAAVKYGIGMGGLNGEIAEMEGLLAKKEMWPALEKGFEILLKLDREIERARDVFEEVEIVAIRIKEAELLGADTDTAQRFMEQAKSAGDTSSALYFLDLAKKDADVRIRQFGEIRERVSGIIQEIRELKESGRDTTSLEKTFDKARLATQYESTMHYLNQCQEEIQRLKGEGNRKV